MERQDFDQKKNKADGSERKEWALFAALSGADEELLERSEKKAAGQKILSFRRYGGIAAAACVLLACGLTVAVQGRFRDEGMSGGATNYAADAAMPMEAEIQGANYERPVEAACEEAASEDTANGAASDGGTGGSDAGGYNGTAPAGSNSAGSGNTVAVQGGQSDGADTGTKDEKRKDKDGMDELSSEMADGSEGSEPVLSGAETEPCGIPMDDRKSLTLEEAGACEYGKFLPAVVPKGYRFESALLGKDADGRAVLTVRWSKGMDDLMIFYSRPTAVETVDIACPEQYDVHLYEIPYCDSVPEEYRQMFLYPVFAEEDFSGKIVDARMKQIADAGDTDTPRGDFSVLLSSGVLVRFCGEGQPEDVFEMMKSVVESER